MAISLKQAKETARAEFERLGAEREFTVAEVLLRYDNRRHWAFGAVIPERQDDRWPIIVSVRKSTGEIIK